MKQALGSTRHYPTNLPIFNPIDAQRLSRNAHRHQIGKDELRTIRLSREIRAEGDYARKIDTLSRSHGGEIARIALLIKTLSTGTSLGLLIASIATASITTALTSGSLAPMWVGLLVSFTTFASGRAATTSKQMKEDQFKDYISSLQLTNHDLNAKYINDSFAPFNQSLSGLETNIKKSGKTAEILAFAESVVSFLVSSVAGGAKVEAALVGRGLSMAGSGLESAAHGDRKKFYFDLFKQQFQEFRLAAQKVDPKSHTQAMDLVKTVFEQEGLKDLNKKDNPKNKDPKLRGRYGSWIEFHLYKSAFEMLNSGKFDIDSSKDKVVKALAEFCKTLTKNSSFNREALRHIDSYRGSNVAEEFTKQKSMSVIDSLPIFEKKAQIAMMKAVDLQAWDKSTKVAVEIFKDLGVGAKDNDANKSMFFYVQRTLVQQLQRTKNENPEKREELLEKTKLIISDNLKPYIKGKGFDTDLIAKEYAAPALEKQGPIDVIIADVMGDIHERGSEGISSHFDNNYHPAKLMEKASNKIQGLKTRPPLNEADKKMAKEIVKVAAKFVEEVKASRDQEIKIELLEKELRRCVVNKEVAEKYEREKKIQEEQEKTSIDEAASARQQMKEDRIRRAAANREKRLKPYQEVLAGRPEQTGRGRG